MSLKLLAIKMEISIAKECKPQHLDVVAEVAHPRDKKRIDKAREQNYRCPGYDVPCNLPLLPSVFDIDHAIPSRWGGQDDEKNKQVLCENCHGKKSSHETSLSTTGSFLPIPLRFRTTDRMLSETKIEEINSDLKNESKTNAEQSTDDSKKSTDCSKDKTEEEERREAIREQWREKSRRRDKTPKRKQKRVSWTLADKRKIILYSDEHTLFETATEFGCSMSCISEWRKKRSEIFKRQNSQKRRLPKRK